MSSDLAPFSTDRKRRAAQRCGGLGTKACYLPSPRSWLRELAAHSARLTAAFFLICGPSICLAQSKPVRSESAPAKNGVWFQIKGAIKGEPARATQGNDNEKQNASLTLKLRISSHAAGSNYYGEIKQSFSDYDLAEGSPEKIYWQDTACHPRRGLPRISVTAIDGTIHGKNRDVEVKARPRRIGVKLPEDEISAASALRRGTENGRDFFAFHVRTNVSKLNVGVRIYTEECVL